MTRNRRITSSLVVVLVGVVVLVIAVSGGSASNRKQTPVNVPDTLSVTHTALGNTLVDGAGRTVYLFQADKPNQSTLSHEGFAVWPAVAFAGTPHAGSGVSAAHIGTTRADGVSQVTYYGHPLYYYVEDKTPGETKGQGLNEFGALWYVLSPQGSATITKASTPAPTTTTESSGYHY
jgi:predicted lipoprotein with Yx(FWY)xxD motif